MKMLKLIVLFSLFAGIHVFFEMVPSSAIAAENSEESCDNDDDGDGEPDES